MDVLAKAAGPSTSGQLAAAQTLLGDSKGTATSQARAQEAAASPNFPATQAVSRLAAAVGKKPETTGEKYANSIAAGVGGLLSPVPMPVGGSLAKNVAVAAAGGAGGQAAADAFGDNALSRIGGSLLGGGLTGLAVGGFRTPNHEKLIQRALSEIGPEDIARAKAMRDTLNEAGVAHSAANLFGDKSSLADVLRDASSNIFTRARYAAHMAPAPEQAKAAVSRWMLGNLEASPTTARQLPLEIQETAAKAIEASKKADTTLWENVYGSEVRARQLRAQADFQAAAQARQAALEAVEKARAPLEQAEAAARKAAAARAADLQAQEAARAAKLAAPAPIPGMAPGSSSLLPPPKVGDRISRQLAKDEAEKAMLAGKGTILGPDGKPLIQAPPPITSSIEVPGVPASLREALAKAQGDLAGATNAMKAASTARRSATEVPPKFVGKLYSKLKGIARNTPVPEQAAMIRDLASRLKSGDGFLSNGRDINDVLKAYSNSIKAQTRSANPIDAGFAKYMQGLISATRDDLGEAFTPIKQANAAWLKRRQEVTNPMQQGLTGQLAQMGGGVKPDKYTARANAVQMVVSPNRRQVPEINQLAKDIGDPSVAALLREHFTDAMEKATGKLPPSLPERLGNIYNMSQGMRGAPDSALRANTDAMLRAAARDTKVPAAELQAGFHKLMDSLEEAFRNNTLAGAVDRTSLQQTAGRNVVAAGIATQSRLGRYAQDLYMARTHRKLIDLAMRPDGVELFLKIAKEKRPGVVQAYARTVASSVLAQAEGRE